MLVSHESIITFLFFFFFHGSGIKILSSMSKYPTKVDHIEKWSSVYMLIMLKKKKKLSKKEWLYHKRSQTKCILFSAFWCVASRNGKGLKPEWCYHLLSLILCLTEMLHCVWKWHVCELPETHWCDDLLLGCVVAAHVHIWPWFTVLSRRYSCMTVSRDSSKTESALLLKWSKTQH